MSHLIRASCSTLAKIFDIIWVARWGILFLSIITISVTSIWGPFSELRFADEREYVTIAQTLLDHRVFGFTQDQLTAYRPPGYIFFISPFLATGFGKQAVNLAQIALWALNAYLAGRLALCLSGSIAAGAALFFALGFPILAYTALTLYPQTLTATLLLLCLLLLFDRAPGPLALGRTLGLGVFAGALILVTPAMILILAAMAILSWFSRILTLSALLTIVVITNLALTPWLFRNWIVLGEPVIATSGGTNLLLGNSESARPDFGGFSELSRYDEAVKNLPEIERDAYYRTVAINWVKANPGKALKLYFGKLLHYFKFREQYLTKEVGGQLAALVMFITYYPLLILASANFFLFRRWPLSRQELILSAIYLGSAAVYAVFITRIRYRVPFDYLIIVLAAIAINKIQRDILNPKLV